MRYFALASLLGVVMVTIGLIWTYRDLTEENLVRHENRANANLTRLFATEVWDRYRALVVTTSGLSRAELRAHPLQVPLRAEVLERMARLQVAKVKIYNVDGITVFSTEERQIGEDKSGNAGFLAARRGEVSSLITFRDRFDAFEGVISNRSLISTYIPVTAAASGQVEGVFEVYSDVTEMLAQQNEAQWRVAGVVLALLGLLYVFLSGVVGKADRTISRQDQERTQREARMRHEAYHDALTGLPNRAYFMERIQESIEQAVRVGQSGALMFVDLDRFKIVNDSLGHDSGDRLLREASSRIQGCLRDSDVLFRMGGDEFTVILPSIAVPEDAGVIARRIRNAIARSVRLNEHEISIGASIGIAVFPVDGDTVETLLRNADHAMYSAKEAGRGTHAFFQPRMNRRALDRMRLEVELKQGFERGQFELHYQVRHDAVFGRLVAVEALLRWHSPSRGMLLPEHFLPVLEENGMMALVGEWVLRTASRQLAAWHAAGAVGLRMSVNISALQLRRDGFIESLQRVLRESRIGAACLEIELHESLLAGRDSDFLDRVAEIKQLGVRVSIDDFGAGQSSLQHLRELDVDFLKLDRSVVADIAAGGRGQAIGSALVGIARALSIEVVAEGVETEAQARVCKALGCRELQGRLFAGPMPADAVSALLVRGAQASELPGGVASGAPTG
jgi:diguanylate cyclase (GGDEF)-like protein